MNGTQMIRPVLGIVLVAVLVLPIVGCQPSAGNLEGQVAPPSPTTPTLATEDEETVPPSLTTTVGAPPTAKPKKEPAPTKAPTGSAARSDPEAVRMVQAAREDLSARSGVPEAEIVVKSMEAVEWSDAGLGCPLPGMAYAQVITPGFRILLEAGGETYDYHTDMGQAVILCGDDGLPDLPALPVNPDEILDGKPWMPDLDE